MNSRPHVVPSAVSAMLLFLALGHHPYGYYTFLRWAVCASAVLVAWVASRSVMQWAATPFVAIAIAFNPIAPVYLHRSTWRPIDVICAVAFLGAMGIHAREASAAVASSPGPGL